MNEFAPLLQVGAIGAVLVWFMTKALQAMLAIGSELRALGTRIDRLSRAQLLALIAMNGLTTATRKQMQDLLDEIGPEKKGG